MAATNMSITSNVDYVAMERNTQEWMRKMDELRAEFKAELKALKDAQAKPDPNEEHERIFNDRVNGRVWTPPMDWDQERIAVVHTLGYNQRTCV